MAKGIATRCGPSRGERALLRGAVLRLGGRLGWGPAEVIALAEALSGRPWRRLAAGDFRLVLEEYVGMVEALAAKAAKRQREDAQAVAAGSERGRNAAGS